MTAIVPTLAPPLPVPGDGAPATPADGFPAASFADALAALLDRALGDRGAPPLPGNVPTALARFDADGFLQGSVTLPAGTPVSLPITIHVAPIEDAADAAGEIAAVLSPATAIFTDAAPPARDGAGRAPAIPNFSTGLPGATETAASMPSPGATARFDIAMPELPAQPATIGVPPASPRATRSPVAATLRASAPRPLRTFERASAAPVTVGLDGDGTTVSVAVTAALDAASDTGDLRAAVARTLARHGLVLGDLRINRRAGGRTFDGRG